MVNPTSEGHNHRIWLVHWEGYNNEADRTCELEFSIHHYKQMINEGTKD